MTDQAPLLARYRRLRQVGMEVNNALVSRLPKEVVDEGGEKLGILRQGVLVFESEDEMAVLMDFCIHDVRRQGRNAVERFLAETPYPPGSDEAVFLQALKDAHYSLVLVETPEPGLGARVRDLVRDDAFLLVDVGLSRSATQGLILASRLIAPGNIPMTTGAALPVGLLPKGRGAEALVQLVETTKSLLAPSRRPQERSEATAALIQGCLRTGASSQISYAEPGAGSPSLLPRGGRPAPRSGPAGRVGRNARCPCGSGKKFKHCCGARR